MFEVTTQAVEVKEIEWSVPKDLEGNVRFGASAADEATGKTVKYMSYGLMLGFLTSYF